MRNIRILRFLSQIIEGVIPNAPAEAGGRGTLRRNAVPVQSAGQRSAQAAHSILSTPNQVHAHRKVPLGRALARPFGMTLRRYNYKNSTNESATSAPALFAMRIAWRSTRSEEHTSELQSLAY